jgi:pimeloyl-ACP methyl ester carboxylesterase
VCADIRRRRDVGDRIDVNGLSSYYEEYGQGEPLILMHGGIGSAHSVEGLGKELAKHYHVFAPDRRGHGHTADVDGPLNYDDMADDTIAFMKAKGIEKAHLVGFSDGGILCLLIALKRPDLIDKMVPISANYHYDGLEPQMQAMFQGVNAQVMEMMLPDDVAYYKQNTPDGADHWPIAFEKFKTMAMTQPTLTTDDLAKIKVPTLVIAADRDLMTLEHSSAIFKSIPGAQLAIVPGASHALVFDRTGEVAAAAIRFLTGAGQAESH